MFRRPFPIAQRVMVNLHDGAAIRGVLIDQKGPLLVLAHAELLEPGQPGAPMDGQVYIERSHVAFIQSMPAEGG